MKLRLPMALWLAVAAMPTVLLAQSTAPSAPATPAPSAAEQFPFPGAQPSPASAPSQPAPAPQPSTPTSQPPATPTHTPSAAEQFPFPGETAPAPDNPSPSAAQPQPAAGDSGFSSSRDTSAPNPDAPPQLHDLGSGAEPLPVDLARAAEDKRVAVFYEHDWNYRGAYQRYKDAVLYAPDDADAHFGMAETARKLGKREEALREFETYLKLKPQGRRASEAQKALADMTAPGGK